MTLLNVEFRSPSFTSTAHSLIQEKTLLENKLSETLRTQSLMGVKQSDYGKSRIWKPRWSLGESHNETLATQRVWKLKLRLGLTLEMFNWLNGMENKSKLKKLFRNKISRPCTFGDFDLREVKGQAVTSTLQKYSKRKSSQSAFMGGRGRRRCWDAEELMRAKKSSNYAELLEGKCAETVYFAGPSESDICSGEGGGGVTPG
jgi:hypothetical protein